MDVITSQIIPNLLQLWKPVLEIVIIWIVLYRMLIFIQGTRTVQVVIGIVILMLVSALSGFLGLTTIHWILTKLLAIGIFAFFIIFQPELRRALARLGQNIAFRSFVKKGGLLDEIVRACDLLSKKKVGALIALERDIGLRNYVESGVVLNAKVSAELLITIFTPLTPLHDGGVIIEEDVIASCGSLFPLSKNPDLSKTLGTRHRAALGLTEETDAVTVVVSEETGAIAVSVNGHMTKNLESEGLRRVLRNLFRPEKQQRSIFELWKGFSIGKTR
jgi:diadenylate cyclase